MNVERDDNLIREWSREVVGVERSQVPTQGPRHEIMDELKLPARPVLAHSSHMVRRQVAACRARRAGSVGGAGEHVRVRVNAWRLGRGLILYQCATADTHWNIASDVSVLAVFSHHRLGVASLRLPTCNCASSTLNFRLRLCWQGGQQAMLTRMPQLGRQLKGTLPMRSARRRAMCQLSSPATVHALAGDDLDVLACFRLWKQAVLAFARS